MSNWRIESASQRKRLHQGAFKETWCKPKPAAPTYFSRRTFFVSVRGAAAPPMTKWL